MTKPNAADPPILGLSVTTTFRELVPLVPVFDSVNAQQPLRDILSGLGSVRRLHVEDDRLLDFSFVSQSVGEQPSAAFNPPMATIPAVQPRHGATKGRADFPIDPRSPCQPPAAVDTVRLNVHAMLVNGVTPPPHDTPWLSYSDRLLAAIRQAFALPDRVTLPVFGYAYRAPSGLLVAPVLSGVVVFTLDPTGALVESHIGTSSLSGAVDSSMLAAVQRAGASHAFPGPPHGAGSAGGQSIRYELLVTTTTPDSIGQAAIVGQIDLPVWPLTHPAGLVPGSYLRFGHSYTSPGQRPDSAMFELVVDEKGKAMMSTVRVVGQTSTDAKKPTDAQFVPRIVQLFSSFQFDPALIGACPVRQLILQPLAD